MANIQFWRSNQMSDTSFLDLVKRTFGKTFTKGIDAKNWLIANGYYTSYPDIVTDGLVLYLDASNVDSFKGEPTTNLSYNNGNSGSEYLAAIRDWVNAGSWISNTNETDVQKPIVSIPNLRILSGIVTIEGSIHFGCSYTNVSPSTTYSISVYFRQNRAGSTSPYIRTNINNNSLGNLSYNGDTNTANWPVNKWIRITGTCTTQSNEDGIYISNYLTYVGDKIWYFGHQVEQKSYVTPLVAGTRGTTFATGGGWCDLSGNENHGELVNGTLFNSSNLGSASFDGVDDYINLPSGFSTFSNGLTYECFAKFTNTNLWGRLIDFGNNSSSDNFLLTRQSTSDALLFEVWNGGVSFGQCTYSNGILNNQIAHYGVTLDGTNCKLYRNGNLLQSYSYPYLPNNITRTKNYIGKSNWVADSYFGGNIYNARLYNKALTQTEITQNFNAIKERFGL